MRIYYDTEFTSLDGNVGCDLISAGFVAANGREWYVEITDFDRSRCSLFVVDQVLPLLGLENPERMSSAHFARWLCLWLTAFGEDVELISDASCDLSLINGFAHDEFKSLPFKVAGQIWLRSEDAAIDADLLKTELRFWHSNPNKQHHALFDARRLKLLADRQEKLQAEIGDSE